MFRVQWLPEADQELTRIWTEADTSLRQAVTSAAHALEEELKVDRLRQGESRSDDERVLFVYPLAVEIEVHSRQRIVRVLHVWRYRRRGK